MGTQKGTDNLEDQAVDGTILKLILKEQREKLGHIKVTRSCKHREWTSGYMTCGHFTINQSPSWEADSSPASKGIPPHFI